MRAEASARLAFSFGMAVLATASWFAWCILLPAPRLLHVTFLDVGQGDSVVIQTPGGTTMVVDAGPPSGDSSQGMRSVVPFLRAQGVQQISALVLTHPDDDHVGGAADLLDRFFVGRLLTNGDRISGGPMGEALATARRRRVPIETLCRGQEIRLPDGVTLTVLHPVRSEKAQKDNDRSLVLRLRYGRTSVLLTGDAEAISEQGMLRAGQPLSADVLKLGHHGSRTSTSPPFLAAVHPRAAIASCGKHNAFGHPHPDVTRRVDAAGARLFRTDRDGAIILESDGLMLSVRTSRRP